jgi:tRNA pseudouridine38-40 synthase
VARYFIEVMYDGTAFNGSQIQGEQPTVQLAINKALSTFLRIEIATYGASRTDEGVHALCSYYHFDIDRELKQGNIYNINAILPETIAIKKIFIAKDPEFNCRFAAIKRRYRYRIHQSKNPFLVNRALFYPLPLKEDVLHQTAAILKEYTNFETFSKRKTQSFTFECTIHESYWERNGEELHYVVVANRFLRGMVRGLVGTQLQVARGRTDINGFRAAIVAKDCSLADFSVAGHGLYLEHIEYPPGSLIEL